MTAEMQTNKKKESLLKITDMRGLKGVSPPKFRIDNTGTTTSKNSEEGRSAQATAELKPLWEAAENEAGLPFVRARNTVSRPLL